MDFGFSGEIIFLALLGLILFGPRRLPEIIRTMGGFVADLKRIGSDFQRQVDREVRDLGGEDSGKSLLSSLVDDFKAMNSEREQEKTIMAPASPARSPARSEEPIVRSSLLANANRIRELLAESKDAAGTPEGAQPAAAQPAAAEAPGGDSK